MPQAFAAVGAFIAQIAVGAGIATGITSATIIGTIGAAVVFGAGAWAISSLLMPRPRNPNRGADAQAVINQATAPRVRIYGRAKVGGVRAFFESRAPSLYQIIMIASHRIDAIEQVWIGDINCTRNSDGSIENVPFKTEGRFYHAWVDLFLGTANQAASPRLLSAFSSIWTSAHRLRGIAYVVAQFNSPGSAEDFGGIWPDSHRTPVRCVVRGAKVYDPRDNTQTVDDDWVDPVEWKWSDNPALCILDYIRCPDGMNKPNSGIDFDSFAAFADLCDEPVALAAGGTEKRYRCGGTLVLTEDPVDVLQRLLDTCDGELYQTNEGKIAIRGGKWVEPTVTITADQILGLGEMAEGNDAFSVFNELKIVYTSPLHDYQAQETVPWVNAAEQARHGQIVDDFVLDMVQSPSQARRLGKIRSHRMNPALRGSIVTNLAGLNALGDPTINVAIPVLSVSDSFVVTGFALRPDLTGCEIGITSLSAAAYEWNPATEEGENPPPPEDTRPDLTLPVPDFDTLDIEPRDIAGSTIDVVVATFDDPGRSDVTLEAQIKVGAGGSWQPMTVEESEPLEAFATFAVASATTYYVRARFTVSGGIGSWSAEEDITAP